jgi:osmotically-inducible protein OsmY
MMENARPVVSVDAAPPPSESVAERGKKAAGRTNRCEHKRKRSEKEEHKEEPAPRNNALRAQISATAIAATAKTSSKKRLAQKRKKAGVAISQRVLTSSTKGKGQGEGVGRHSSQYRGVSWDKSSNKWKANIQYNGKVTYLGCFEDEDDAARAYDRAMRVYKKALPNFPTEKEQAAEEAKQQHWIKCGEAGSKHRGVSWDKRSKKWIACIKYDGKQHGLGSFEGEEDAARAYDKAARAHHGEKAQLHFPAEGESGSKQSSNYRGVTWEKKRYKWAANIRYDGKQHHLGYFEDEEEAARAYDRAARVHHGEKAQLNFPAKRKETRGRWRLPA